MKRILDFILNMEARRWRTALAAALLLGATLGLLALGKSQLGLAAEENLEGWLRGYRGSPWAFAATVGLFVAAAFAQGRTVMRGLEELRVKESDRISVMARGLAACGVRVEELVDGLIITGSGGEAIAGGATVAAELDHRIAMSFAILGLNARHPVTIDDARPIATSFPGFVAMMEGLGAAANR